jgi:hypothetical protein
MPRGSAILMAAASNLDGHFIDEHAPAPDIRRDQP